jgi:NAD(P)H-hydrate epimerase
MTPTTATLPALTAGQMREVDRIMVDELHIDLIQMMENAGRNLADLAQRLYSPASAVVLAGSGGNAGGGLVAARHLANRGVRVTVVLAQDVAHLAPVPAHQLAILRHLDVPILHNPPGDHCHLVIDALIGYSLRDTPRGHLASLIVWANDGSAPVLSLDTPSGLYVTTGGAAHPCVQADATLTLGLPKIGLLGAPQVGRLYLADISVPPVVYHRMGIHVNYPFADGAVVELDEMGQPR